jgi:hypothetical protein
MLTRIELKQGEAPDKMVRGWIKRLHSYSHVDRKGLQMIMRQEDKVLHYALGPSTQRKKGPVSTHSSGGRGDVEELHLEAPVAVPASALQAEGGVQHVAHAELAG